MNDDLNADQLRFREMAAIDELGALASVGVNESGLAQAEGLRRAEQLIATYSNDAWGPTQVAVARARLHRSTFLSRLDEDDQALAALDGITADFASSASGDEREVAADALLAKIQLLAWLKRTADVQTTLQTLVDRFAGSDHAGVRHTHALAQLRQVRSAETPAEVIATYTALRAEHDGPTSGPEAWAVIAASRPLASAVRNLHGTAAARRFCDDIWQRYRDTDDPECIRELGQLRLQAIRMDASDSEAIAAASELTEWLATNSDERLAETAVEARVILARNLRHTGDLEGALAVIDDLLAIAAASTDPDLVADEAWAAVERGSLLRALGRRDEAIEALRATRRFLDASGDAEDVSFMTAKVAVAYDWIADMAADLTPPVVSGTNGNGITDWDDEPDEQLPADESEQDYAAAVAELVDLVGHSDDPGTQRIVAAALYDLGVHQRERLHLDSAVDTYGRLADLYLSATDDEVSVTVAQGMMNRGFVQMVLLRDFSSALQTYNAMIDRYQNHTSRAMRDVLAKVNSSRVTCLNSLLEQGQTPSYGTDAGSIAQEEVEAAAALKERAIADQERGDHLSAVAAFDQILTAHGASLHPEWRRRCADAMVARRGA